MNNKSKATGIENNTSNGSLKHSQTSFDRYAIKDAIKALQALPPKPENPFVTIAKNNGFDLEKGDLMLIHPLNLSGEARAFLHKNVRLSKYIPEGNVYFIRNPSLNNFWQNELGELK